MKQVLQCAFIALTIFYLTACNHAGTGLFAKKTAREKYEDKLEKVLTPEAIAWKRTGDAILQSPITITAPYAETGIVRGDSTDALAYFFSVAAGQQVAIRLQPVNGSNFTAYAELWEVTGGDRKLVEAADTLTNFINHSSPAGGNYIVRMQPQLVSRGHYQLSILLTPMLGHPISSTVKSNIGSVWGDDRDAGARKHEGIDIFAKKGSPVVAVSDGTVDRVSEGGIGGKVVWLSPENERFAVYYAHLDTQFVQSGQQVTKGQVLGTVGNTGNARYTPAHLHFGIYAMGGAINPLYFIQPVKNPAITVRRPLNQLYKTTAKTTLYPSPEKKNALRFLKPVNIRTLSYNNDFYRVVLENGDKAFIAANELSEKMKL